jgi:hypothetical protein
MDALEVQGEQSSLPLDKLHADLHQDTRRQVTNSHPTTNNNALILMRRWTRLKPDVGDL